MSIHYEDQGVRIHHGDCIEVMRSLPDNSVDAVVTDPPYGLEFMGKDWEGADGFRRSLNEADAGRDNAFGRMSKKAPEYRTKPAGKIAQMGKPDGTPFRSQTGTPSWGANGNPTCLNCGGDKYRNGPRKCNCEAPQFPNHMAGQMHTFQAWCEAWAAECLRVLKPGGHMLAFGGSRTWHRLAAAVEDAGFEIRDSIAWLYGSGFPKSKNLDGDWQGWGTALKPAFEPIVMGRKPLAGTVAGNVEKHGTGALNIDASRVTPSDRDAYAAKGASGATYGERAGQRTDSTSELGRWPANVVVDASQSAAIGEEGRFFPTFRYEAKAPTEERPNVDGVQHPTVKPLDLMRWLVRLVTPPNGTVLEPFAGSGTTVEACLREGFECIAIEREGDYLPLILQRIRKPQEQSLFGEWEDAS